LALGGSCQTPSAGRGGALESYRDAIRKGDLAAAYALTSPEFRAQHPFDVFQASLASNTAQQARISALNQALDEASKAAPELGLQIIDAHPKSAVSANSPADVLERFLDAAERHDFSTVYRLMAARWRAQYSVQRLEADFAREPRAKVRLLEARQALHEKPVLLRDEARFPLDAGRAVVLLKEREGYRVASLE
jgi:hypothetical protein